MLRCMLRCALRCVTLRCSRSAVPTVCCRAAPLAIASRLSTAPGCIARACSSCCTQRMRDRERSALSVGIRAFHGGCRLCTNLLRRLVFTQPLECRLADVAALGPARELDLGDQI